MSGTLIDFWARIGNLLLGSQFLVAHLVGSCSSPLRGG